MNDKKGFTIIELLAVIILLAIILLIAIFSISSISESLRLRQKNNLKESIKIAGSKYLNDVGLYDVYAEMLIKQGYLEYDKIESGRGIIIDPTDSSKNLNCFQVIKDAETNEIKLIDNYDDSCINEQIQTNSDLVIQYCVSGNCKDVSNNWISTLPNTEITLKGRIIRGNLNINDTANNRFMWITSAAPDLIHDKSEYSLVVDKNDYIYEQYTLSVINNNKEYNTTATLKVDHAAPRIQNIGIKCDSGATNCENIWKNSKKITATIKDGESGLYGYKIVTSPNSCNTNSGWTTSNVNGKSSYNLEYNVTTNINTYKNYYICVKDIANNITTSNAIQVKKIDNIAPTCSFSGGNSTWTTSNVDIYTYCNDNGSGCKTQTKKDTISYSSYSVSVGGFYMEDNAGNIGYCYSEIIDTYIDKEPPSLIYNDPTYETVDSQGNIVFFAPVIGKDSYSGIKAVVLTLDSPKTVNISNYSSYSNCSSSGSYSQYTCNFRPKISYLYNPDLTGYQYAYLYTYAYVIDAAGNVTGPYTQYSTYYGSGGSSSGGSSSSSSTCSSTKTGECARIYKWNHKSSSCDSSPKRTYEFKMFKCSCKIDASTNEYCGTVVDVTDIIPSAHSNNYIATIHYKDNAKGKSACKNDDYFINEYVDHVCSNGTMSKYGSDGYIRFHGWYFYPNDSSPSLYAGWGGGSASEYWFHNGGDRANRDSASISKMEACDRACRNRYTSGSTNTCDPDH